MLFPQKSEAQKDETIAAVASGLFAIGSALAAIEQMKEQLEHKAVEEILANHGMEKFKLKTGTLDGVSAKDMSSIGVVTFEIENYDDGKRYLLFSFLSSGWINQYGVNFNKVRWMLFNQSEWNSLIKTYVETAARKEFPAEDIGICEINTKGIKKGNDYILTFTKMDGDTYLINNYSEEIKIVFNEGNLGLYLKQMNNDKRELSDSRGSLVQIRRRALIRAHSHINFQ
tara:strand:- start:100 stop:783 length:684 start_codon:yes stop_codon:yes gene_type:complete